MHDTSCFQGTWVLDHEVAKAAQSGVLDRGNCSYLELREDGTAFFHAEVGGYSRVQSYPEWAVALNEGSGNWNLTLDLPLPYTGRDHVSEIVWKDNETFIGQFSVSGDDCRVFSRVPQSSLAALMTVGTSTHKTDESDYRWAKAGVDIDSDGYKEILLGAGKCIYVYSGKSGSILGKIPGIQALCIPDRDEDRMADLLSLDPNGKIALHSGRTLSEIKAHPFRVPIDGSATTITEVRDCNSDGVAEILITIPGYSAPGLSRCGGAWLLCGSQGDVICAFCGAHDGDELGTEAFSGVARADSTIQIILGARDFINSYSLRDGQIVDMHVIQLGELEGRNGRYVIRNAGDVDGDGCLDLFVPGLGGIASDRFGGCMRIVSTRVGGEILFDFRTQTNARNCGKNIMEVPWSPVSSLDANLDGFSDVAIGTATMYWCNYPSEMPGTTWRGSVAIVSGKDGSLAGFTPLEEVFLAMRDIDGTPWDECYYVPWAIAAVGDVDNDGVEDVLAIPDVSVLGQGFILSGRSGKRFTSIQLRE